jgi:hypothetical protein
MPGQPVEDPSELNFTVGEDADGDGFPGTAVVLRDSRKWNLVPDSDDQMDNRK